MITLHAITHGDETMYFCIPLSWFPRGCCRRISRIPSYRIRKCYMRCPCNSGRCSWATFASRIRRVCCGSRRNNRSRGPCYSRGWYHSHTLRMIKSSQSNCSCTTNLRRVGNLCRCLACTCAAFTLIAVIQVQVSARVKGLNKDVGKKRENRLYRIVILSKLRD